MCYARRQRLSWARIKLSENIFRTPQCTLISLVCLALYTFFLGYLDLISKIKCTFLGILRVLSGSSFDVPCFASSSFVVQFSRSVLAPALRDSLYSISHTSLFVNPFLDFFQIFFPRLDSFRLVPLAELYYTTTPVCICQVFFSLFLLKFQKTCKLHDFREKISFFQTKKHFQK